LGIIGTRRHLPCQPARCLAPGWHLCPWDVGSPSRLSKTHRSHGLGRWKPGEDQQGPKRVEEEGGLNRRQKELREVGGPQEVQNPIYTF
jgi:hypothetical protein